MGSVGFKEWAVVCDALGRGEQSVLVRKGGIAEGRDGFAFREREFFLFPTFFHAQLEQTRLGAEKLTDTRAGEIELRYFAKVTASRIVTDWDDVIALEPLHILKREVIEERFGYGPSAGVHVAFVQVFRLHPTWVIADAPGYRGCRSWVALPDLPEGIALEPVGAGV